MFRHRRLARWRLAILVSVALAPAVRGQPPVAALPRALAQFGTPVPVTDASVGQAPRPLVVEAAIAAAPAAPPAAPAVPAPAAGDRWILMKVFQGTWVGDDLNTHRLQISGWTDVTFTASSDQNSNLPMGFNWRANELMLQQNWLRFERSVVTSGTTEPTFGFRSDTILPGGDYRFTLARGIFNEQLTASNGEPQRVGIDPIQFYTEAYVPTIGRGLDIKFGRFFAQYGVEANDAPSNALASHAYTFIYDPFTHTGLLGSLKLTDSWAVQAGLVLGSDVFIDPADQPTFIGTCKWTQSDQRNTVQLSVITGSGRFNQGRNFNNPNIFDLVATHQFNPRLAYNFESLFGYETNVPNIGNATWFGILNYLTYTLTPRASATTRLEFFDDVDGQRTGFSGLYSALTAGVSFRPIKAIIFRPELRYDYNGESRPYENKHALFTATADVIVRW
jgi:hypothetical protein